MAEIMPSRPFNLHRGHRRPPNTVIEVPGTQRGRRVLRGKDSLRPLPRIESSQNRLGFLIEMGTPPVFVVGRVRMPHSRSTSFHCSRNCSAWRSPGQNCQPFPWAMNWPQLPPTTSFPLPSTEPCFSLWLLIHRQLEHGIARKSPTQEKIIRFLHFRNV